MSEGNRQGNEGSPNQPRVLRLFGQTVVVSSPTGNVSSPPRANANREALLDQAASVERAASLPPAANLDSAVLNLPPLEPARPVQYGRISGNLLGTPRPLPRVLPAPVQTQFGGPYGSTPTLLPSQQKAGMDLWPKASFQPEPMHNYARYFAQHQHQVMPNQSFSPSFSVTQPGIPIASFETGTGRGTKRALLAVGDGAIPLQEGSGDAKKHSTRYDSKGRTDPKVLKRRMQGRVRQARYAQKKKLEQQQAKEEMERRMREEFEGGKPAGEGQIESVKTEGEESGKLLEVGKSEEEFDHGSEEGEGEDDGSAKSQIGSRSAGGQDGEEEGGKGKNVNTEDNSGKG